MSDQAMKTLSERYLLQREIGRGGMGIVYQAYDRVLGRDVAIKTIGLDGVHADARERFLREGRMAAKLDHGAIVPIYDLREDDETLYFVMPLVPGDVLGELLLAGPLSLASTVQIGLQIAAALEHSHERGVVHRDIKPGNVMIERLTSGRLRAKVMDFGVAIDLSMRRLTGAGAVIGTPAYFAPEQFQNGPVDGRADLYALGVVLYECVTGDVPFQGPPLALVRQVLDSMPLPPHELSPLIPRALSDVVMQCLQKDPADRPQQASELIEALRPLLPEQLGAAVATGVITQPPQTLVSSPTQLRTARLVGRAPMAAALQAGLARARAGRCQLLGLCGQTGSGKSALLRQLAEHAEQQGVLVLRGRFVEPETVSLPYKGYCDLISSYYAQDGGLNSLEMARADRLPTEMAASLALTFPMLSELPALAAAAESVAAQSIEAVRPQGAAAEIELLARALARLRGDRRLLLIIDDMHNATVSADFIPYLFRRLGPTPTTIVVSFREEGAHDVLKRIISLLRSDEHGLCIELPLLDQAQCRELIEQVLDGPASDDLVERLYQVCDGNPMFCVELLKSFRESDHLRYEQQWELDDSLAELAEALPPSLQDVVETRLARLTRQEHALLSRAAVLGTQFSYRDLVRLSGGDDFEDSIESLLQNDHLREDCGGERLSFASEVMRRVLYGQMSARRRRELHRKLAEALLAADEQGPTLARHYALATMVDEALALAIRLAERALAQQRPAEAYEVARSVLSAVASEPEEARLRLSLLAARAAHGLLRPKAALSAIRDVIGAEPDWEPSAWLEALVVGVDIAVAAHDLDSVARWARRGAELAEQLGRSEVRRALLEHSLRTAEASSDELGAERLGRELAKLSGVGLAGHRAGPGAEQELSDELVPEAERLGDLLFVRGEYLAARDAYQAARQERRRQSGEVTVDEEVSYLVKLAKLSLKLGRYEETLERCRIGMEPSAGGLPLAMAELAATASMACTALGRFGDAEQWLANGFEAVAQAQGPVASAQPLRRAYVLAQLERGRGNMLVGRGEAVKAIEAYLVSLDHSEQGDDPWEHSIALFNVAEANALAGRYREALDYLERAFGEKAELGDRWGLSYTYLERARIRLDWGELGRAEQAAQAGLSIALELGDPKLISMLYIAAAEIELAGGRWDEAAEALSRGSHQARQCGARVEIAAAQCGLARVHAERHRWGLARKAAGAALAIAEEVGAHQVAATAHMVLGCIDAKQQAFVSAAEHHAAARPLLAAVGNPYRQLDLQCAEVELSMARGDRSRAIEQAELVRARAGELSARRHLRRAHRILTMLGKTNGDTLSGQDSTGT